MTSYGNGPECDAASKGGTANNIESMKSGCPDGVGSHKKPDVQPIKDKIGQAANYQN